MLAPFPKDNLTQDNSLTRTWDVWMKNLQDLQNFGDPPSSDTEVTAAGGVNLTSHRMRIKSATAGAITITKNPQISAGYDGQEISIEGLDNTKTVTLTDGNGLATAGGASFTLGDNDIIRFSYNKSKNLWIEHTRSNN